MATIGLPKSLSVRPVARQSERAPAALRPTVVVRERSGGMSFSPRIFVSYGLKTGRVPCEQEVPVRADYSAVTSGMRPPEATATRGAG
ncbi:hypothetical protein MTP03_33370 [Tsukamurella sp. PLM1]|nr:hypothetical protein MTP03_33370 [Tsukamurella sp. PLM1]